MKIEETECSETMALKLKTPENNPEESKRHPEHGGSLKSSIRFFFSRTVPDRSVSQFVFPLINP
jgi:hypothetical protein